MMIIPNLEVVYPPNLNLAPPKWRPLVNVICVHDIGGSSKTTWHHDESGKTWISDPEFLGTFANSARIWTYGFNSEPSVNMTPSSIALHANELLALMMTGYIINRGGQPTIFIGHGLGGTIVKKAVILSMSCPEFFLIRDSLAGVVFFDTVHHSTDSEGVLTAVKTIAALNLQKGSLKLSMDDTRQYADAVREVNSTFMERLPPDLDILNFVATRRVELKIEGAEPQKTLVVPKRRAELDSPQSKTFTIDCNHFELTRFPSPADNNYLKVSEHVMELMTKASADPSKKVFLPPPPPNLRNAPPSSRSSSPEPDSPIRPRPQFGRPLLPPPQMRGLDENSFDVWLRKKSVEYAKERRDRLVAKLGDWNEAHLGYDINPVPGTCTWIQSHPYFLQWSKSNTTDDFYVFGTAGCGKTHLAKSVANHLSGKGTRDLNLDKIVLPFFCNVSATGDKKPPIMEYMIKSILRKFPAWFDTLESRYQHPDTQGKLSMASLFNILREIMTKMQLTQGPSKVTTVFLIVDGLNECDSVYAKEFLQLVASLVEHPAARTAPAAPTGIVSQIHLTQAFPRETVRFKFLFTYTPNEIMELASVSATRVKMKDEQIRKDISTYVDKTVEDFCNVKSTKDPKEEMGFWIKENAESFFLFATCAMEDTISTAKQYEYGYSMSRRLFPSPQKLGQYYDHDLLPLFQSVANDEYALSALHIILSTLTFVGNHAIRDALACLHDTPRLRFIDIQTIMMHRCPRLIRVSDDFEVYPIHPSLQFHFSTYVGYEEQHANMASLCLRYLSQAVFDAKHTILNYPKDHPFYNYAACNWREHFRLSKEKGMKLIPRLRHFINSYCYLTWCRYLEGPLGSSSIITPPTIALIPANAANIAHLVHDVIFEDDPKTYPWQDGIWGMFWRLKRKTWRKFPEFAKFVDSFRDRQEHMVLDVHGLSPLIHAAKAPGGLPDMVHYFLQRPTNINWRDPIVGATAMMFFCKFIQVPDEGLIIDMVGAFIDAGADINMSTYKGETCLWLACSNGNLPLVRELLYAGADPNIADKNGSTPLHQAFSKPTPDSHMIIMSLIRNGADLNIKFPPPDKLIPLTAAIINMLFDTFLLLLNHVEDINQLDDGGFGAIHFLVQPMYTDWLPHLLKRPDLDLNLLTDSVSKTGKPIRQTALSFAIAEKSFTSVKLLLEAGASPYRHPKATDKTPLQIAVDFDETGKDETSDTEKNQFGNLDVAELLLSYKSPLNTLNPKDKHYSRSPLMRAVTRKNYQMVELFLKNGADPTLEEAYGFPGPLDSAVGKGNIDIAKLLLQNPIPPSINYIPKGFNHILVEALNQNADMVRLLLDHGADTKRFLSPGDSKTPLQAAAQEGNLPMCKVLIEHEPELLNYQDNMGLVCETPLNIAAREGRLDVVRYLLEVGAKTDIRSYHYEETPLWSACSEGKLEIAKLIHAKSPETINIPSYEGETPLMVACSSGALKLVAYLLENGADMTPRCMNYNSCVGKALRRSSGGRGHKIIQMLIQHGLGVDDVVSSVGYTVLGEACRSGDLPAVRLLLDMGADPAKGQKWPGGSSNTSENRWRSALQVAALTQHPKALDALLEHPRLAEFIGNVDFYGENVLHANIPLAMATQITTKVHRACERLKEETGVDHFQGMLSVKNYKLLTPLDTALGGNHRRLDRQAVDSVDEIICRYVSELRSASERTVDAHYHLVRDLARLLLCRHGYDDQAVRLMQTYVAQKWVKTGEGCFEDTVLCNYYCDECESDEEDTVFFCRYCVWNTGQCCIKDYKGIHQLVEVAVVKDRSILDLNSTEFTDVLGLLERDFITDKQSRAEESSQPVPDMAGYDYEDTTLSLAFLHALGYLEFRRRAWSSYLPLAPKVYKRLEPWEPWMREERREFQQWVWRMEMQPWRLKNELEYFLESGRRAAYRDKEVTKTEQVMSDMGWMFKEYIVVKIDNPSSKSGDGRRERNDEEVPNDDYEIFD
ncbi:ankyrin unc44 [Colletotrichum truncatum]|uniref:Ankyrin unc44 n=1 Tax=Colletotrichum truncatum TaxID=5467 RepID=A0ACC3YY74_COLTU|nr:ankyrin unc44 [Colletotrichum truncatum]KAF6790773.1 ankyrin unc44 [Colletotrichum truncatum]